MFTSELLIFLIKILWRFGLLEVEFLKKYVYVCKFRWEFFFSGENKLLCQRKEKKLTPIYIWEKNLVSRQLTCTFSNKTAFIKNDITVLKSLLTVTARMSFAFDSRFLKKKKKKTMRSWSRNFLGRWEKL